MADTPQVVLVAGMHRSGTSLAAEMLVRMGGYSRERLLEGNEFNPRGYWEDVDVVWLHDRILSACDRAWASPRSLWPMPEGWERSPSVADLREELEAFLVGTVETATAPWILKDPRVCRLLPLWLDIASRRGIRLSAVLCARAPDAVAASLHQRDSLPVPFGRLSWLVNTVELLETGGDLIGGCVSFDRWFDAPAEQVRTLAAAAGLTVTDEMAGAVTADIPSRTLRHHVAQPGAGTGIPDRLYEKLRIWAETGCRPTDLDGFVEIVGATLAEASGFAEQSSDPEFLGESLEKQVADYRQAYQQSAARADDLQSLVWRLGRPLAMLRALRGAIRGN